MTIVLSVVITTYNRANLVRRAIESIVSQEQAGLEVIVVDDGSTDGTAEVLAGYGEVIRVCSQDNAGACAARNAGAKLATGRYLVFLDSDDEALPGWAGALVAMTASEPGVCSVGVEIIGAEGVRSVTLPEPLGPAFAGMHARFLGGAFAVRQDLFDRVDGYDQALPANHQTDLALRLARLRSLSHFRTSTDDRVLLRVHSPRHGNRSRDRAFLRSRLAGAIALVERHEDLLRTEPTELANTFAVAGVCAAQLGDHRMARRCFVRAVRADPAAVRHHGRLLLAAVSPVARLVWRLAPEADGDDRGRYGGSI